MHTRTRARSYVHNKFTRFAAGSAFCNRFAGLSRLLCGGDRCDIIKNFPRIRFVMNEPVSGRNDFTVNSLVQIMSRRVSIIRKERYEVRWGVIGSVCARAGARTSEKWGTRKVLSRRCTIPSRSRAIHSNRSTSLLIFYYLWHHHHF